MLQKYHVLYTSDENFFPHMLTSIYSLLENNKDIDLVVHIIESGFSKEELKKLEVLLDLYSFDLKIYSIEQISKSLISYSIPKWRGTDIANARLLSHEVLRDIDKALYIDSDTIVVDSLKSLFEKETDKPLLAVKEIIKPEHMKKLKSYYNSGVLLFDYTLWEDEDCSKKIYDMSKRKNIELIYPDQDLMNLALNEQIGTLSPSYNVHPYVYYIDRHKVLAKKFYDKYSLENMNTAVQQPHILHCLKYIQTRVWEENNVHPFNSFYEQYRSIWKPDFIKEKNDYLLSKLKPIAYINALVNTYASFDARNKIKTKIKQFVPKNSKDESI